MLENALKVAKQYPVFPCAADKKPTCKTGFKAATQDEDRIRFLWGKYGGELVGVPTGEVSGIDALDIDPRHDGEKWLEEAVDSLPVTRCHQTRSGGKHFLFRHADKVINSASKIAPGVDVRGQGGFIIWWPAHDCKIETPDIIEEWPQWLLRILLPPPPKPPSIKPASAIEANTRAALMIERAYARVRTARAGERHAQLRAAAATLGGVARFTNKSPESIKEDLVHLIMATGAVDRRNAEKTADWAFSKGSGSPLLTSA